MLAGILIHGEPNTCVKGISAIDLKEDADLIFFPSYAVLIDNKWRVNVHAWVYEPEKDSVKRKLLIDIIKKDFNLNDTDARSKNFENMASYLLVDQEGGKDVAVSVEGLDFCVGRTNKNGHTETVLSIEDRNLKNHIKKDGRDRFIPFVAQTASKPARVFSGKARIIESNGIMVISDIDDTIKISNVRDRQSLIENTFFKPFKPVPGMAGIYRNIARDGAVFHYVSASPWQLYRPLSDFLKREGFPDGLFYMKYFGFSKNLSHLFAPSDTVKMPYIKELLRSFPAHRFILIGDSGERDPEIYGECARSWTERVIGVYIRNVTEEKNDNERMEKAFYGVPSGKWHLFKSPEEFARDIIKLVRK
jgi:phosphatidate phosphatase APP1